MKISKELAQAALDALELHAGNSGAAHRFLRIPRSTFRDRIDAAKVYNLKASKTASMANSPKHLRAQIRQLETELRTMQEDAITAETIKQSIVSLRSDVADVDPPAWALKETKKSDVAFGVPTLVISDMHVGEVVDPKQINHVNAYNLKIFDRRMETLAESTVRLLNILSPKMDYPGIVLLLGGDNISGDIHEELTMTNEIPSMPTMLYLYERMIGFIKLMAEQFKSVHIVVVTGNHGRNTRKIWNKSRHHTSFDWLLGCFLAKHFETDERITFQIPDAPDAYYKIYDYRYCLTHGDQFRSFGDSMIGALGPIIRGDVKKRSRNSQIDLDYDTIVMGHWHQYMHFNRLIVNGTLKGYDEYSYAMNYAFEQPSQALWLTHPRRGITYRMPVYVEKTSGPAKTNWVSVAK